MCFTNQPCIDPFFICVFVGEWIRSRCCMPPSRCFCTSIRRLGDHFFRLFSNTKILHNIQILTQLQILVGLSRWYWPWADVSPRHWISYCIGRQQPAWARRWTWVAFSSNLKDCWLGTQRRETCLLWHLHMQSSRMTLRSYSGMYVNPLLLFLHRIN